jgi:RimJ/RimL family protein N-acetyltransferase
MGDVTIRLQTEDDVVAVVDILEAVGAEGRWIAAEVPFDKAQRIERLTQAVSRPEHCGFVAEVDGRVVGNIGLELAPYGVAEFGMALLDGFRGQGIGARLVAAGVEWARSAGAHKMSLQVWPHNERAIALYRKMGFVDEGLLRQHYRRQNGELWDAVVMGLLLDPRP